VVEGLYTPTSNPALDESSGAYDTASFEPFSNAEAGLYGGREDVSFEEQQGNPRQRLAVLQQDDRSTHKLAEQHDLFLGDIEGVTSGLTPTPIKMGMTDEDLRPPVASDDDAMRADAPTSVHGAPDIVEMEPTRPVDMGIPAEYTPAPHEPSPPPQELGLADVEFQDYEDDFEEVEGVEELEEEIEELEEGIEELEPEPVISRAAPTYPEFNVIPDFNKPLSHDTPTEPEGAQSGRTVITSPEELGLMRPPPETPAAQAPAPAAPGEFEVLPSFGGPQPAAGFTVVAAFDAAEGPGDMGGGTMIASAEDVEAWRSAGLPGSPEAAPFDEARTGMYTPAPGSLEPITPESPAAPFGGAGLGDDALTAMRVGRGSQPAGGAGFELNPRGPAPELDLPVPEAAAPGPSPRRTTSLDRGGRPAPPPEPRARPQEAEPKSSVVPPLRGSGSVAPAAPQNRRSLVEDALAQLKRRTEEKRKSRGEDPEPTAAKPAEKPATPRRKRRLGKAELADPALADLYKAAMTDLTGSRD
jgi:hypothetical protein